MFGKIKALERLVLELWDENETILDRLDDLEAEVRTLRKDLNAQILINKVKK